MPRRHKNQGHNNNGNSNSAGVPPGRGGRGGRGRGRGGRGGRGRGDPPSNPNSSSDLNGQQAQSQPQQDRLQPEPPARPLPQTQPPQPTQPQLRSQSQAQPSWETSLGPLLSQGLQTSYTLDLFNSLSLNPNHKDSAVVFEGNFNDFTLGNLTPNPPQQRGQRQRQRPQFSDAPAPASVPAPQGPTARGRGGPWRGGGWRGRPSIYGAPLLSLTPPFQKVGPNRKNNKGSGLGYAHPVFPNSGPSSQYPKRLTTFSKTPRIPLEILERDRPLLKPIAFVRGEQQTLLFKEKEEILHVPGEEKEHADRILPSADIVEKIFHIRPARAEEAEESNSKSETEDHTDANTPNSAPAETGEVAKSNREATLSLAEFFVQREEHTLPTSLPHEVPVEQQEVSTTISTEIVTKDEVETIGREESGLDLLPILVPIPQSTLSTDDTNPPSQPEETQLFIISTDPTITEDTNPNTDIQYISTRSQTPLGVASDDEVVYEAPNRYKHPRPNASFKLASTSTLIPPKTPNLNPTPLSSLPSLTLELTPTSVLIQRTVKAQAKSGLKMTPRMRRMIMLGGKGTKRRKGSTLFTLGLEREERILESDSNLGKERKGMKERRRHDSDLDWGTEEDSEEESNGVFKASKSKSNDREEEPDFDPSELDPDLNLKDLIRFVHGAEALSKGNGTGQTIDDLEDGRKMDEEDEEEETGSGMKSTSDTDENDSEKEDVFHEAERRKIKELEDESSSDSSSSSEIEDFKTKLYKLRAENGTEKVGDQKKVNGKGKQKAVFTSDTESSEDDDADNRFDDVEVLAKADEDEQFISEIRDLLSKNEDILQSHASSYKKGEKNRKERRKFKAIFNGSFGYEDSDLEYADENLFDISYNSTKIDKINNLPPGLKARWEQDRVKKAEQKRERQLRREIEQMELAAHISPSGKGKLSKLQRNLLQRSAVDSSTLTSHIAWDSLEFKYVSPSTIRVSKITDLSALDSLIRSTFFSNLELQSIILPPKDKQWRAKAHELCTAFYLKNKSEGREGSRFLTISRTSMTGVGMKEGKINNLLRRSGRIEKNGGGGWVTRGGGRSEGGKAGHVKRTRDGDEVGAAAPKISSSNIGFKILEKMGWSEGQRIGITGGLADPLTAIIKTSKLGLGATR